ncbi:MAG: hypothetical protein IJQ81_10740 [Oscillibacter sp.]|nr:hypothetical protein [Oscillibacter sp.]
MRKRLLAGLLSVLTLLALCACSGQSNAPAADASTPVDNADATESADSNAPAESAPETADADTADSETAWPLTVQDMIDANAVGKLAQTYGSMRADYVRPEAQEYALATQYADAEIAYLDFGAEQDLLFLDGSSGYFHSGEQYVAILEFDTSYSAYNYFTLDPDLTAQEEIISVETDGDAITMTTRLSPDVFRPYYDDDNFPYNDVDCFEEVYTLNASDYAMLGNVSYIVRADGTREEQDTMTVTYGAERPEGIAELMARKNAEDPRVGTIILDPGTPEERTVSATARKGDPIQYSLPDGYVLYADPDGAEPIDETGEADYNADFTLYAIKEAE